MRRVQGLASMRPLGAVLVTVLVTALVAAAFPAPAAAAIPARYLTLYRQAARTCPGLSWPVLAGIGTMESDNGQSWARGPGRPAHPPAGLAAPVPAGRRAVRGSSPFTWVCSAA
jgi:hypothetical protein